MTVAGVEGAASACKAAMRFLPRPGISRGNGAWHAVLSRTEALCVSGRCEEAGRWQAEAKKIAAAWDCSICGFPARTAGIAAASAGNWTRAEEGQSRRDRAHGGSALRYRTTDRTLLVCDQELF